MTKRIESGILNNDELMLRLDPSFYHPVIADRSIHVEHNGHPVYAVVKDNKTRPVSFLYIDRTGAWTLTIAGAFLKTEGVEFFAIPESEAPEYKIDLKIEDNIGIRISDGDTFTVIGEAVEFYNKFTKRVVYKSAPVQLAATPAPAQQQTAPPAYQNVPQGQNFGVGTPVPYLLQKFSPAYDPTDHALHIALESITGELSMLRSKAQRDTPAIKLREEVLIKQYAFPLMPTMEYVAERPPFFLFIDQSIYRKFGSDSSSIIPHVIESYDCDMEVEESYVLSFAPHPALRFLIATYDYAGNIIGVNEVDSPVAPMIKDRYHVSLTMDKEHPAFRMNEYHPSNRIYQQHFEGHTGTINVDDFEQFGGASLRPLP